MKEYFILMADIVSSRKSVPQKTAAQLLMLVNTINKKYNNVIISPLTITLGDEFQAIIKNTEAAIQIIFQIEELSIEKGIGFKLRYVLFKGKIETAINHKIAYGMLGEGLTSAREAITKLKKTEERFFFKTGIKESDLNLLFIIYQSLIDDWKQKDFKIISDFLKLTDYKLVAEENEKTVSQMWKKRKSLKLKEYRAIKTVILHYGME